MAEELITWSDDFLMGEENIDAQHQELVKLINSLYAGAQMGGVMTKVSYMEAIKGGLHYIKTHFSYEEEMMEKSSFPFYKEHKKQHEGFVAEISRSIKELEKVDKPDPGAFILFLKDWVLKHIADADKKYAPYVPSGRAR